MKVIRVIVYDGTEEAIDRQLGNSRADGTWKPGEVKMTFQTICPEDTAKLGDQVDMLRGVVIKAMDWVEREVG